MIELKSPNIVVISVEEYDELRKLKKDVEENKDAIIEHSYYDGRKNVSFIGKDEALNKMQSEIDSLDSKEDKLNSKISELQKKLYFFRTRNILERILNIQPKTNKP